MKKINFLYAFFVCLFIVILSLFVVSIEISLEKSLETTKRSYQTYTQTNVNRGTSQSKVQYSSVKNIEELYRYIDVQNDADPSSELIIIGTNGNYIVHGMDTGINSRSDEAIENTTILLIEQTSETEEEFIYTILNSKKQTKEFKINKNTKKVESELDIKIGDNGNWFINGMDTFIQAFISSYEEYLSFNPNYKKSQVEWLQEVSNGSISFNNIQLFTCLINPNNEEFPYYMDVYENTYLMEPMKPVKKGYTFIGWYDNDNKAYVFGEEKVKNDIILNAKYIQNDYRIVLDYQTNQENTIIQTNYGKSILLPNPIQEGCTFMGWMSEQNDLIKNNYLVEEDSILVAKWSPIYTIGSANSFTIPCNSIEAIKDTISSDGWYCDDILALLPRIDQVYAGLITSIDGSTRASSEQTVINELLKLDIVGETKLEKTAMIQDLDYESEPRYYVRT